MKLPELVHGMTVTAGELRFGAPALDDYFAALLPAGLRAAPGRLAFAAACHGALLMLRRQLIAKGLSIGLPGPDDVPLKAAAAGLHPGLDLIIGPGTAEQHRDRVLRALLTESDEPPGLPSSVRWPAEGDASGTTLVALLSPGRRWPAGAPWDGMAYLDAETFTLGFRP
ncbi:hypothetical protein [Roseomonas populi]|uniref:Uncharacterized protein n=1 Tax=Roseomonas populi TaxID=3121582 RepID=A0ABT1X3W1_9PROT|nr:hypothetical protein [Roseomonas pecuniae]MCR0982083.1 hypothetical protein [Roseomonas pecuniae]